MARATGTLAVLAPEKGEFRVPHGQAGPAGAWPLPFCQAGVWPTVTAVVGPTVTRFSRAQTKPKVGLRGFIRTSPGCWELSARGRHSISPAVHPSAPRPLYRGTGSESALLRQNRAAASLFFCPSCPPGRTPVCQLRQHPRSTSTPIHAALIVPRVREGTARRLPEVENVPLQGRQGLA